MLQNWPKSVQNLVETKQTMINVGRNSQIVVNMLATRLSVFATWMIWNGEEVRKICRSPKMNFHFQKSASIQPRTRSLKCSLNFSPPGCYSGRSLQPSFTNWLPARLGIFDLTLPDSYQLKPNDLRIS